ncbi:MAG: hypothetical protein N2035_08955 [Chthoniobacterales bacterium]|nr:hypothetical protein [Chthoniobacterales bacterium]
MDIPGIVAGAVLVIRIGDGAELAFLWENEKEPLFAVAARAEDVELIKPEGAFGFGAAGGGAVVGIEAGVGGAKGHTWSGDGVAMGRRASAQGGSEACALTAGAVRGVGGGGFTALWGPIGRARVWYWMEVGLREEDAGRGSVCVCFLGEF